MSPKRLVLAPKAQDDLTGIFVYIAQEEDVGTAATFVADLTAKIQWIADTDFPGVPRDWIRPGLKALPYRKRCIYFRTDEDTVTVLRIIHGRQDVEAQEFG
ncbi:type II toxin-antitoxin system RelE/ParE family toxin [Cohaesibacter sp. ES.047]|uniref:type II toxin-antitoxin system RelE/ParE family toxin n=1 Tax=Cohaesibacter sp. ES.047 TaxID=1798205 RepID=UPI000BB99A19|nr:type II toxin-antitoxin system RelE/ParE family toxin [Cohaesibacter sp. ES.047]